MNIIIENFNNKIVTEDVLSVLKNIYDPEIDINIFDLGLIYEVKIDSKSIYIKMTLTTINCPEAQLIPSSVKNELSKNFPELETIVDLTFEPAWNIDNIPDEIQLALGLL